ncbi:hypothetical protein ACLX1H_009295 [Fusarium chlamydosporum]
MSSGAVSVPPGKYEFLVVVHDKPNMREKRLEVRGQHFENMKPNVESGNWKMGGAILNSVPKDDSPSSLDFAGSTLVCIANSVEEIREQLSKDIYATSGVWDMDKASTPKNVSRFIPNMMYRSKSILSKLRLGSTDTIDPFS